VPVPDKKDLRRFCELDGWEQTKATSPDHHRYRKTLENGDILRTRVSLGRGPACDDPALWNRVWRYQLALANEAEFWEVLRTRRPAGRSPIGRGAPTSAPQQPSMPAWLFEFLVNVIGLPENNVLDMTDEQAMRTYMRHIGPEDPASGSVLTCSQTSTHSAATGPVRSMPRH
jgi:hypothetical protein